MIDLILATLIAALPPDTDACCPCKEKYSGCPCAPAEPESISHGSDSLLMWPGDNAKGALSESGSDESRMAGKSPVWSDAMPAVIIDLHDAQWTEERTPVFTEKELRDLFKDYIPDYDPSETIINQGNLTDVDTI